MAKAYILVMDDREQGPAVREGTLLVPVLLPEDHEEIMQARLECAARCAVVTWRQGPPQRRKAA